MVGKRGPLVSKSKLTFQGKKGGFSARGFSTPIGNGSEQVGGKGKRVSLIEKEPTHSNGEKKRVHKLDVPRKENL